MHRNRNSQHTCECDEVFSYVAVGDSAVICAPVGHYGVNIAECSLTGDSRSKPSGRPCLVGALVNYLVNIFGNHAGVTLCDLEEGLSAVENIQTNHCHWHFGSSSEMRRISAASEIAEICTAPVCSPEHCVDIFIGNVPPALDDPVSVFVLASTCCVKSSSSRVYEVDKSVFRQSFGFPA